MRSGPGWHMPRARVVRVHCGGQAGVDRAAVDFAAEFDVPYGGWVPRGGAAEDLVTSPGLLELYPGFEASDSDDPSVRTRLNVRDADATLILVVGHTLHSSGTELTRDVAGELRRPLALVDLSQVDRSSIVHALLARCTGEITLNIAGPRESECPGVYDAARRFLREMAPVLLGS